MPKATLERRSARQASADLLHRYDPEVIILVAGATPHMRPLQQQTWETFSANWPTDVRIAFHWLREVCPNGAGLRQLP
jgi:hypothetical protein